MACAVCESGWLERAGKKVACRPCHRMRKSVQDYVEELAGIMGLADWDIKVSLEPADDENMAEIDCAYAQRNAEICLNDDWRTYTPDAQRATLTHELVHALLAPYTQHIDVLVKALVDREELSRTAAASLSHMEEIVVDQIAVAWAATLPLPETL